jgi:hypothetical protein
LFLGVKLFYDQPSVGLPIVAVFGIMILFGALALVSSLFAGLGLDNRAEALALPSGSIRAAIALALIVLFALISVMLYESLSGIYKIDGLSEEEKSALTKEPANHVVAVIPYSCPATASGPARSAVSSVPSCDPGSTLYTVHLRQSPSTESTDLAKQLLILIGTLMTSVTSFYFASRAGEAATKAALAAVAASGPDTPDGPAARVAAVPSVAGGPSADEGDNVDGCSVPIESPTEDKDLPPSKGGVAS